MQSGRINASQRKTGKFNVPKDSGTPTSKRDVDFGQPEIAGNGPNRQGNKFDIINTGLKGVERKFKDELQVTMKQQSSDQKQIAKQLNLLSNQFQLIDKMYAARKK